MAVSQEGLYALLAVLGMIAVALVAFIVFVPVWAVWKSPAYTVKESAVWTIVLVAFPLVGTLVWALFDRR